ncbi:hypothetical protein DPMN_185893 [Dreissena polymorpha]|uniref:Uncharacterized protein n=1 Tax=Dreissena polymorpha TaxID=45954 RepID=A0A9D4DN46_DREPO|nr:hypothetical protein DPMN_185893 [Dreissena polymorpha]
MKEHMGTVISRYEVAAITSKAYLKAMSPWNVVSAFKKTGIHPLNKDAVAPERLLPCESFRDTTLVLKVKALQAGRDAVEEYLQKKLASKQQASCTCTSNYAPRAKNDQVQVEEN